MTALNVPALAEDASVGDTVIHLAYSLDTFYFLMSGALVMWMAAGFAMLEAGLVRSKNTTEILLKNVALYAIACTMYMICGYAIMYPDLGTHSTLSCTTTSSRKGLIWKAVEGDSLQWCSCGMETSQPCLPHLGAIHSRPQSVLRWFA